MILTLNAGSSSIKFALYRGDACLATGLVDRIGADTALRFHPAGAAVLDRPLGPRDHQGALAAVLETLEQHFPDARIKAVGHRVVHGGPDHVGPARITPALFAELEALAPFAPLHQPHNLAGVRAALAAFPDARQVACFDTAFHRGHAFVHDAYALPRAYFDKGLRRYGFHGLSYQFIAGELSRIAPDLHAGRVVVAHLGNGASLCGMVGGRSVASTMGFSPLDGLPMGTRPGQLDPGVVLYLMQQEGMSAAEISDLLYRRSGLLGLSGLSNDMRRLEASDSTPAQEAIAYFTTRIRREIAALAADLDGLDGIVFTAGIGENSARLRAAVLNGLGWLGLTLDPAANDRHAQTISAAGSAVRAMVIPTDEERVIARGAAEA